MERAMYLPRSSTIRKAWYRADKKILGIVFTTGYTYHYFKVPALLWQRFKTIVSKGGSAGSFFNRHIRDHYEYEKL